MPSGNIKNKNKHMKTTFTNKTEYLAYRANWKAKYNELSQKIRALKQMAKEESRACNEARKMKFDPSKNWWSEYFLATQNILNKNENYQKLKTTYPNVNSCYINKYKEEATAMLEELKEAKVEANRQYLASKQLITA
jgi:hypothetical protein